MAKLPNFLVIIRSEKLSGKGQGRGVGVRKKERFVLGKRTFRSQKSKHFVLRIIITVVLNGIVVQNNYVLKGTTPYTGLPKYVAHGRLPLSLQDHGVEVAFRNIWIRNL